MASLIRSISRFSPMAALRAPNMAMTIHPICPQEGKAPNITTEPSNAPIKAKGKAKTVCSNLIICKKMPIFLSITILLEPNM
ncbi:hypothetical protein D3C73_564600 [compost metagenome]